MAVKIVGSEPDDKVPDSFEAWLCPEDMSITMNTPAYMIIPSENAGSVEFLDTECGALSVSLKDLIIDYADECLWWDGGDGLLQLARFFEQVAPQLRAFHKALPPEAVAAAHADFDLVIPDHLDIPGNDEDGVDCQCQGDEACEDCLPFGYECQDAD